MENEFNTASNDDWRAAGVDSWNVEPWSEILSTAGLGPEDVRRWRSAGLNVSSLPLVVPHLSHSVGFDDVLETLHTWGVQPESWRIPRAEELLRVLQTGIGIDELLRLRNEGVGQADLLQWCDTGIPPAGWTDWIAVKIPPKAAAFFAARQVDSTAARQWIAAGLSADEALQSIDRAVSEQTLRGWISEGISPSDAAAFLGAAAPITVARDWIASDVATTDAVDFVRARVPLSTAKAWFDATDLDAGDVIDFIEKDVSLEQALEFAERGIETHQVTRTEFGLDLDLDPWQVDPVDQLPKAIDPGPVNITLWTTALGGDPMAHDVIFNWDGDRTATWYEDISDENGGLSVMSSSPTRGVLAWPDGKDVLLTYTWSDLGLSGHDRLADMAPTYQGDPTDPAQWLRLADALVDFVLLDLGSGSHDGEDTVTYLDTAADCIMDLDEMFEEYAKSDVATSRQDFEGWLEESTAAGRYEVIDDEG